ncbi:hypothetical protein [Kitasatospora sp. DSM 101779]|uniref:SCO2583/SCO2584 N-terminal domain-containing protein n=1 Tax=Kitasatospora sp. DSM 101779 TaxID=2853165 RepID=UPI0021DA8A15|nr:hypothetical protein [Kitasatospora sp. DSM 101779]MCU7820499.1 hypothetical protein [Kitasatospora sp. DSM 101779]
MPIADDPQPRPSEEPEPGAPDPFDGLVLDERFVRAATVKEPAARTRELSAKWRVEPPVDPGGRRWSPASPGAVRRPRGRGRVLSVALAVLATAVAATAVTLWPNGLLADTGPAPELPVITKAQDTALPGGGTSVGSKCGAKGFHHYAVPPEADPAAGTRSAPPGPQLVLTSYGFERLAGGDPGRFTVGLGFARVGGQGAADLPGSGPLTAAVEIEGPEGLVGGAYGLPIRDWEAAQQDGAKPVGLRSGGGGVVELPLTALCPGVEALDVSRGLAPPVDGSNTITGQPRYTLTVSVSDPAVGDLRRAAGSPVRGDVLSATNRMPFR